jgi:hypothetical protein
MSKGSPEVRSPLSIAGAVTIMMLSRTRWEVSSAAHWVLRTVRSRRPLPVTGPKYSTYPGERVSSLRITSLGPIGCPA